MRLVIALLLLAAMPALPAGTPTGCDTLCGAWVLDPARTDAIEPLVEAELATYKPPRAYRPRLPEPDNLAREWIARLGIKTPSEYKDCGGLSGGNQQKVVLAKWRSGGSDNASRGSGSSAGACRSSERAASVNRMAASSIGASSTSDMMTHTPSSHW